MKKGLSNSKWDAEEIKLSPRDQNFAGQQHVLRETLLTQLKGDSIMNGQKRDTITVLMASTPEGKSRLSPGELYRAADRCIGIEKAKPEDFPDEVTMHNSLTGKSRTMRRKGRPELQNIPVGNKTMKVETFYPGDFAELEKRITAQMDKPEVQEALKLPRNHPARFATLYGGFV